MDQTRYGTIVRDDVGRSSKLNESDHPNDNHNYISDFEINVLKELVNESSSTEIFETLEEILNKDKKDAIENKVSNVFGPIKR